MASGTVGHFPSEEQQWIDLWESSLSTACEVMLSRPRACSPRVFCPPQQTVSTRLYSYENIARQTATYPVPPSEQWEKKHVTDTVQVGHL